MHGYCEYAGYDSMEAFIEHTVRRGSVIIHPRWQTDIAAPCPGPYYIEPCLDSAVAGVRGAMLGDTRAHRSPAAGATVAGSGR